MEKIIVREKILNRGQANSEYINLCNETEYDTVEKFLKDYNAKIALSQLFGEEINCEQIEDSNLYDSYLSVLKTQKENDDFQICYPLDDEFAVHISQNIYLYHLVPKNVEIYTQLTPWFYADSKKYLGDTWWEEDEQVIDDLKNLSLISFYKKYRCY